MAISRTVRFKSLLRNDAHMSCLFTSEIEHTIKVDRKGAQRDNVKRRGRGRGTEGRQVERPRDVQFGQHIIWLELQRVNNG